MDKIYIVSACLMGINCKYDGGHNYTKAVEDFLKGKKYITICPEALGGLPIPRVPSEIQGSRVMSKDGRNITEAFLNGAQEALKRSIDAAKAQNAEIEAAILKQRSPSCGNGLIYDGSFSGRVINGNGIAAQLFMEHGICVFSEENLPDGNLPDENLPDGNLPDGNLPD